MFLNQIDLTPPTLLKGQIIKLQMSHYLWKLSTRLSSAGSSPSLITSWFNVIVHTPSLILGKGGLWKKIKTKLKQTKTHPVINFFHLPLFLQALPLCSGKPFSLTHLCKCIFSQLPTTLFEIWWGIQISTDAVQSLSCKMEEGRSKSLSNYIWRISERQIESGSQSFMLDWQFYIFELR